MIENDSNPRPFCPAIRIVSSDEAAIHTGRCGYW